MFGKKKILSRGAFMSGVIQETQQLRGLAYPLKTSPLRRLLTRRVSLWKLHPNPDDEFCDPKIGPNDEIMNYYVRQFRKGSGAPDPERIERGDPFDPLQVQRISTGGYMILNGHHRWGAACETGQRTLKVRVVNLTQEADVQRSLASSSNSRRAVLDLDEVIFRPEGADGYEKYPLLLRRAPGPQIRLGVPALLQFLNRAGYDIWLYTARYESEDDLRRLFRLFQCPVTGVVTGLGRKAPGGVDMIAKLNEKLSEKYTVALHIDNSSVIRTGKGGFREVPLSTEGKTWSGAVMDAVKEAEKG